VLIFVAWAVVIILICVAMGRIWGTGPVGIGAVASSAVPVALLLAWPILVFALAEQQWFLAAAAASLVGCHVAWLRPRGRRPTMSQWLADAHPMVTVFTANAFFANPDISTVCSEIVASGADVVIILELTPGHVATLHASGVLDAHQWKMVLPDAEGVSGIGLWSRLPVLDLERWNLHGVPQLRGRLELDEDRTLGIVAVHVPPPWPGSARRWTAGLAELGGVISLEARPVLVAGDLNATWDHRPFRDLMGTGLRDAAIEAGCGSARTWPNRRHLPALIRIDHILISGDVTVVWYRIGQGQGSDHRPVVAAMSVRPSVRP
jgi:endonuclease/exonuclease/phosphatase (EEP) superfamily protein YafD